MMASDIRVGVIWGGGSDTGVGGGVTCRSEHTV